MVKLVYNPLVRVHCVRGSIPWPVAAVVVAGASRRQRGTTAVPCRAVPPRPALPASYDAELGKLGKSSPRRYGAHTITVLDN